jgi:hypothetical protein
MPQKLPHLWHRSSPWNVLVILGVIIGIAALVDRHKVATWDWTAIGTLALALVTVYAVLQARAQSHDEARQRHVLAFRMALMEVWKNLQHVAEWSHLQERPTKGWTAADLSFTAIKNVLVAVWEPSKLWYRITSVIRNIEAYAIRIDDAVGRGGDSDVRPAREWNRYIDLYFRQLARYLYAEMQRQGLDVPTAWNREPLCEPLAWPYCPDFPSVDAAARNMESGGVFPPHVPFAAEPDDPAYSECRLAMLIARARERHAENQAELHATMGGWKHVSGGA